MIGRREAICVMYFNIFMLITKSHDFLLLFYISFSCLSPQWVPPLHPLHRDKVPDRRLLLAQSAGGALHHPHTQALFFQLHHRPASVVGSPGRHPHHPHPHPRFPHLGHDWPGGLVQQAEWHPGLGHDEEMGVMDWINVPVSSLSKYCTQRRSAQRTVSVGQIIL